MEKEAEEEDKRLSLLSTTSPERSNLRGANPKGVKKEEILKTPMPRKDSRSLRGEEEEKIQDHREKGLRRVSAPVVIPSFFGAGGRH